MKPIYTESNLFDLDSESILSDKAEKMINDYCSGRLDLDFDDDYSDELTF